MVKKKTRVLHLLASNKYSGAENVACGIINNYEGEAFYCSPKGPICETLKEKKITYIPLKMRVSYLKKIIKDYHIDVVHAHDFKCSVLAAFVSKQARVISHLHCNPKFLKSWNMYSFTYNVIAHRFSKIIVVSKEILDGTVFYSKIKSKTVILNNVVDRQTVIERSNKFDVEDVDVVFLGRLIPLKQPLFFIDIINKLKETSPNIKAYIIGDGELYSACLQKIKEEHLEQNIFLVGFQENPFPYIVKSKVAILPSTTEGLPMSVIECMILDVPVVNSGVGGLTKMFNSHEEYICQELDEYVACIQKLLHKSKEEIHQDCVEMIEPFIDMKSYMKEIVETYK